MTDHEGHGEACNITFNGGNCIGGVFWKVYINSSDLIYVVIIFLKLKIY